MTVEQTIGIILAFFSIGGSVIAAVHGLVKHYFRDALDTLKELKPNGGSSIHDRINKDIIPMLKEMQESITDLKVGQAKLVGKFEQHMEEPR